MLSAVAINGGQGRPLERVGYDGPGDRHGCLAAGRSDHDNADDLVSQVRADDARGPALCCPAAAASPGRAGKGTAIAPDGHGDVVAAEWFVHVWHRTSGV
jgi:hypothetical protein